MLCKRVVQMRPNALLSASLRIIKHKLRWHQHQKAHGGIIGMHVRHGDSCGGSQMHDTVSVL
jgi:hypothetical protein